MMARTTGLWIATFTSVLAIPARAQSPATIIPSAPHSVAGTIADGDGNPIDGAEIELRHGDSTMRLLRSDVHGRFRIDTLPDGSNSLRVRHLGFHERTVAVPAADRVATLFVKLDQSVAALDAMSVEGEGPDVNTKLREFYARAQSNHFGHFIDEQQLAQIHPQQTSDALRAVPGVVVRPSRRIGNEVRIRGCAPLVWVDGLRAPGGELDELTRGADVAAIEIYSSTAGVPAQYMDRTATCGTILVWLKVR
jgi:hypothetical protein